MKFLSYLIESIKTDVLEVEVDEDLKVALGVPCLAAVFLTLNSIIAEHVFNIPVEKSGAMIILLAIVEAVIAFVIYYINNKYKEFAVIQENNKIDYIKKISHRS